MKYKGKEIGIPTQKQMEKFVLEICGECFSSEKIYKSLVQKKWRKSNGSPITDLDKTLLGIAKCGKGRRFITKERQDSIIGNKRMKSEYERKKEYEDFLKSDYWKMVRDIKLKQSENKCQVCGSKSNLNVHHNTYAHHGKEHLHLADLVVLCKDCHSLFHHKLPKEKKTIERKTIIIEDDFCPF